VVDNSAAAPVVLGLTKTILFSLCTLDDSLLFFSFLSDTIVAAALRQATDRSQ
jgi:hypothetical protein